MIDKDFIRNNPEKLDEALANRMLEPLSKDILSLDLELRNILTTKQRYEAQRNSNNNFIAEKTKNKEPADELKDHNRVLDLLISSEVAKASVIESKLNNILHNIPNIPDDSVPTTLENLVVKVSDHSLKQHDVPHEVIGKDYGLEVSDTVSICGTRFVSLTDDLARLDRKLINFMLDHNTSYGFKEVSHPVVVKSSALFGTGNFPKFTEDVFSIWNMSGQYLIPTSEVFLTNLAANKVIEPPLRYTAASPCFRSEVGAAGKDQKGLIRLHQFNKVELVSMVKPADSNSEHEMMMNIVEELLKKLQLPYRVVLLSTKDMGFSSSKTYDFEVWFPSQKTYREISSVSNCKDFQARRMNAKYKLDNKKKDFIHTLNGSSLAVGRTIAALLENHYDNGKFQSPI